MKRLSRHWFAALLLAVTLPSAVIFGFGNSGVTPNASASATASDGIVLNERARAEEQEGEK
jgi:hypothetical protein